MKPSALTAEVVREELEYLISHYPDRTGSLVIGSDYGDDDTTCVYYIDQDGAAVSYSSWDSGDYGEVELKTPVCIVGQWIESFHPEFKENEVIRSVLLRNATMRHATVPFDSEVFALLVRAQDQQDAGETSWGDIDLDKVDPYHGI